jgi:hypothetical protein
MATRELYHGTAGDNILQIIREHSMRPNQAGKIYFSEHRYESVLMHGADIKRKATFAIKVGVDVPANATFQRGATAGVADTLIFSTVNPIAVEVLELYIRQPRGESVQVVKGAAAIYSFLTKGH